MEHAFTPAATIALAASATSVRKAITSAEGQVMVYNLGSVPVFVAFGSSTVTAAVANTASTTSKNGFPLHDSQRILITPPKNATHVAVITNSAAATSAKVYVTAGYGSL